VSERMHESKLSMTPGQLLSAAREARSYSQADIAKRTCLSVQSVNDIEQDEYSHIGVRTFVRGYLCTYARLVGVPEVQILEALEASGLMPALPDFAPVSIEGAPVLNVTHHRSATRYSRWVAVGISLLLVVGIVFWLQNPKDPAVKNAEVKTKTTALAFAQPEVVIHSDENTAPKVKMPTVAEPSPVPVVHTVKKVKKPVATEDNATADLHPTYVVTPATGSETQ